MEMGPQYDLSRLPENTALKQQTLPAQQLNLSASIVLSIFFATGGFCLSVGVILLLFAKSTKEIEVCPVLPFFISKGSQFGTLNGSNRFKSTAPPQETRNVWIHPPNFGLGGMQMEEPTAVTSVTPICKAGCLRPHVCTRAWLSQTALKK